jgi:hypothetical protein
MADQAADDEPARGDPRKDPAYLDRHIKHIPDEDLFAALDLSSPALEPMRAAVARKDYPAAYGAWATYWAGVAPKRELFTGDGDFLCPRAEATAYFAASKPSILAAAQRLLRHDIQGWGTVSIQHGSVVDFNADYGKSGKYGFHYWMWARPLVQAFLVTGDDKYLAEFDELFNQWYEQRDRVVGGWPGLDVVYYELGLGVRNRLFLENYFLPYPKRTPQTHERMLKTLLGAARWLHDEERLGYREHNWQIIGAYGLAHIGLMVPEFTEARGWVELGARRLREHVAQDFFPDGCHSERCPSSYMLIAYRDPRNLALLLSRDPTHRKLADGLRAPLERSLDFWLGVLPPGGVLSGINDGSRSPMQPAILQDGKDLFGRSDALWVKRHVLGIKSGGGDDASSAADEPKRRSVHFPASGFTVMRSDWSNADARFLLINHGPSGGGHSHADALSFEFSAFGKALAIDAGIGETYDDPLHASWYVHGPAHNMVTVDGADCDRAAAAGTDVAWTSNERYDHFAATHRGYEASKGIVHRRHVVLVKPAGYVVVYDVITSRPGAAAAHALEWNLHLTVPPDASAGPAVVVAPAAAQEGAAWERKLSKGWASVLGIPGYEPKHQAEIDWLRFESSVQPGQTRTLGVLLHPFAGERPAIGFRAMPAAADLRQASFVVEHPGGTDRISFTEGAVEVTADKA